MANMSSEQIRKARMREVAAELRRIAHWTEQAGSAAAKKLGIHPTDLACIGYLLDEEKPVTLKQIVNHMGVSSSSGTGLGDRLEHAGFIRRVPHPDDRRSVLIELDRDNAAEPIEFYRRLRAAYEGAMEGYAVAELSRLADFLSEVCEAVNSEFEKSPVTGKDKKEN